MKNLCLLLACLLSSTTAFAFTNEHPDQNSGGVELLDIVCLGRQVADYSPGLTFTPREVTTSSRGVLSSCVSPTHPGIFSGTLESSHSTSVQSCLLSNPTFTRTVRWNTGHFSTYVANSVVNLKPDGTSVVVSTGEVIAGIFRGARIEQIVVLPNTAVTDCLTAWGLTEAGGAVTLSITPVP